MRPSCNRHRVAAVTMADYARAFVLGALASVLVTAAVVGTYALKSRLGINLMQGPSPLHGIYVAMRRAGMV